VKSIQLKNNFCIFCIFCLKNRIFANSKGQMMTITPTEKRLQLHWYPMRITYGRPERMKRFQEMLNHEHIENFMPMRVVFDKTENWDVRKTYVPAVNGLIFVHSSQEQLTNLKMTRKEFEPMRYCTNHFAENESDRILVIPDGQMENFMRTYKRLDSRIALLEYTDFIAKPGKRVRITQGDFENTVGTVKRIKKSQCVVVEIEGFTALAITFVPPAWLEEISESDYQQIMSVKK